MVFLGLEKIIENISSVVEKSTVNCEPVNLIGTSYYCTLNFMSFGTSSDIM